MSPVDFLGVPSMSMLLEESQRRRISLREPLPQKLGLSFYIGKTRKIMVVLDFLNWSVGTHAYYLLCTYYM